MSEPGVDYRHLVFNALAPTNPNLVFGDETEAGAGDAIGLVGSFPGLVLTASVYSHSTLPGKATLVGYFPQLDFRATGLYDPQVARPTVGNTASGWRGMDNLNSGSQSPFSKTGSISSLAKILFEAGDPVVNGVEVLNANSQPRQQRMSSEYCSGISLGKLSQGSFSASESRSGWFAGLSHRSAINCKLALDGGWEDYGRGSRPSFSLGYRQGLRRLLGSLSFAGNGQALLYGMVISWQEARIPWSGFSPYRPPPKILLCYDRSPTLTFDPAGVLSSNLIFVCEYQAAVDTENPARFIVPVRKVYLTMNSVRLFKVEGMVELPVTSFSLDLDMDSWAWGFQASLPGRYLSQIMSLDLGAPIELEAHVNNEVFLLLAEKVSRSRQFGKNNLSLSGRGHSAYLATPYCTKRNFSDTADMTAQQLMLECLKENGVSIGWGVDWKLTDWFVPANVWSEQGSYMDAVKNITASVAGFVLPHPRDKLLQIKPRYPIPPWEWDSATIDLELPSSVAETESIEWSEKAIYNSVYVSGQSAGVIGFVKRKLSNGLNVAPMITDSLITSADAARQRGLAVLADTGKIATVKLSLPVLPETGIIQPGQLLRYVDGASSIIGLTKSVSVSMSAQPTLRQSIELEVHSQ